MYMFIDNLWLSSIYSDSDCDFQRLYTDVYNYACHVFELHLCILHCTLFQLYMLPNDIIFYKINAIVLLLL